jgi:hypothetical protein
VLHRLLTAARSRPLAAVLFGVSAVSAAGAVYTHLHPSCCAVAADGNPRLVLNRVWFDHLPEKPTEDVQLWLFFGGGVGVHEKGSAYRATTDVFEFERRGDHLALTFLHDKKGAETKFKVTACDEKPPFDLCLDLESSPRGPKRWYGFGNLDEAGQRVPWSQAVRRAAESRSRAR